MTITTQNFLAVSVGSSPNDGTGDDLRTAFQKVNANFGWIGNTGFSAANISATSVEISGNVVIGNNYKPTSNTSAGTAGQIVWDSGNIYVCVATNTWVRAALTSTF
jgi:hypothetical protein